MTATDVLEATLTVALLVFVVLVLVSLVGMRWRRYRGQGIRRHVPRLARYIGIRLGIALGIAGAFFVLLAAALTLNSHRPPTDTSPVIRVAGASGTVTLGLSINQCGDELDGTIVLNPVEGMAARASIYTDQDGRQKIPLNDQGRGRFQLGDPTAKRALLSCYFQLPVVIGDTGDVETRLKLGVDQEVDAQGSVPAPANYQNGSWEWHCRDGTNCHSLATLGASVEPGTQQVIVLVLAALFGSIIAVFLAEILLEPVRRRLKNLNEGD